MCFSVQVERDLDKVAKRFGASVSQKDFKAFYDLQKKADGLDSEDLKKILGLKRKPSSSVFKEPGEDGRIFPGYFAPVVVIENDKKVIKPMRYRVRPAHSLEEIPSKYNVFNARLDSLEKRRTWNSLFLKNHGLFPFLRFFEWVEKKGQKTLVSFKPQEQPIMWAPMLFDHWVSPHGEIEFSSFALITNEPTPEVQQIGHDRCPIFMKEDNIDLWLNAKSLNQNEAFELLKNQEQVFYNHQF